MDMIRLAYYPHTGNDIWRWTWDSKPISERLTNPLYGRKELDLRLQEMAKDAPSIEQIWEITKRLPLLSKLLSEEL